MKAITDRVQDRQLGLCHDPARFSAGRRRDPADFLFPRKFFRRHVRGLPPVPAYMFHRVEADEFERICQTLRDRKVRPVTFQQILDRQVDPERSVALTFDDGWSSIWSVVFPIARRFDVPITLFVNPASVLDRDERRSTMVGENMAALHGRDQSAACMLTWGELDAMHRSGLVNVQSHSMHHAVVFVSDRPCGAATRDEPFPLRGFVPALIRRDGRDILVRTLPPGAALHPWAPALTAESRWLDVERRWESDSERLARLAADIGGAKRKIESRLPGASVRVLAPPWAVTRPSVAAVAAETGHEAIVLGYPFENPPAPRIAHYPRLFGDSIWTLLEGPVRGLPHWLGARRRALARRRKGEVV